MLGGAFLLRQLGAAAKRLSWVVAHLDPLIFMADTVGAVLVLLLRSTNNEDMRFDLVVDRNGGTAVSPRPILMCLYSVNLGLTMKFLRFA